MMRHPSALMKPATSNASSASPDDSAVFSAPPRADLPSDSNPEERRALLSAREATVTASSSSSHSRYQSSSFASLPTSFGSAPDDASSPIPLSSLSALAALSPTYVGAAGPRGRAPRSNSRSFQPPLSASGGVLQSLLALVGLQADMPSDQSPQAVAKSLENEQRIQMEPDEGRPLPSPAREQRHTLPWLLVALACHLFLLFCFDGLYEAYSSGAAAVARSRTAAQEFDEAARNEQDTWSRQIQTLHRHTDDGDASRNQGRTPFSLLSLTPASPLHFYSLSRAASNSSVSALVSCSLPISPLSATSSSSSVASKQRQLNSLLRSVISLESELGELQGELASREWVLQSYKRLVHKLKQLQSEYHDTMERRIKEAQSQSLAAQLLDHHEMDLSKYKTKLLSLIFGNKTLEESRRETSMMAAADQITAHDHAHDPEIFRLLREETEKAHHAQLSPASEKLVGVLLGGKEQQIQVESVMRIQEIERGEDDSPAAPSGQLQPDDTRSNQAAHPQQPSHSPSAVSANIAPEKSKSLPPADKLIDSAKNEYILSKPGDSSKKAIDPRLIYDIGIVIVASALGGIVAAAMGQPILLGYLAGGMAVGPGGMKLIGQFIQIETLAQFGATFLLFALGVEFSLEKLRKVKNIALYGGLAQLVSLTVCVSLVGVYLLDLRLKQTVFLGCLLSMSSTTVVVKSLVESKQLATLCGQVMLGLLIIQDLFLSIMLALINLARFTGDRFWEEAGWLGVRFAFLACIVVACMYLYPYVLSLLDRSASADLFLLGIVALCVFLTVVSEKVINSAAVGAFLSGLLLSSAPHANPQLTHRALRLFGPIRDMFGALFFCSIGMMIHPATLLEKAPIIAALVSGTIILKSVLTLVLIRCFGYSLSVSVRAGLGLSQIGEFAFVLASEGLGVGLLTRDMYALVLGTTAVSICVTPAILAASNAFVKKYDDSKEHGEGDAVD